MSDPVQSFPPLSPELRRQLERIEPSVDGPLRYYPCAATLMNGERLERVFLTEGRSWLRLWGISPGRRLLDLRRVRSVTDSANRLPARYASELYRAGESAMGAVLFVVVFGDGTEAAYGTGNAVDFIVYPPGKTPADVVAVKPHAGRGMPKAFSAPDYYWCLFADDPV